MPGPRSKRRRKSAVAVAIGRVLQTRRNALDITQEEFAERVDLSKNYIGNIERGEYEVAISTLHKIAVILKTQASELVREAGY
jgi:transcriptional regulator with XRE-family HTH domain